MGSTMKATMLVSDSSLASSAGMSLYGMISKPGMKGPYPPNELGSVLLLMAAIVRPQKLFAAKRTFA